MHQILKAVGFLHNECILHRDLKPQNILVNRDLNPQNLKIKIADFGLARQIFDGERSLTIDVVTPAYRAPEVVLGCGFYGRSVDLFSIGCIMGELILGTRVFDGHDNIIQLADTCQLLGTPTDDTWIHFKRILCADEDWNYVVYEKSYDLSYYKQMIQLNGLRSRSDPEGTLGTLFGNRILVNVSASKASASPTHCNLAFRSSPQALELLRSLLCIDPRRRISARDACKHPFFIFAENVATNTQGSSSLGAQTPDVGSVSPSAKRQRI